MLIKNKQKGIQAAIYERGLLAYLITITNTDAMQILGIQIGEKPFYLFKRGDKGVKEKKLFNHTCSEISSLLKGHHLN